VWLGHGRKKGPRALLALCSRRCRRRGRRASKHVVETRLAPWDAIHVIPGCFQIVSARNTGIAFSLFDNSAAGRTSPWLIAFSIGVLGIVAWLLWQARASRPGRRRAGALELPRGAGAGAGRRGRQPLRPGWFPAPSPTSWTSTGARPTSRSSTWPTRPSPAARFLILLNLLLARPHQGSETSGKTP